MSFTALKTKATQLRKEGKMAEALTLYQQLWQDYRKQCSPWEGWGLAYCLKKLEQYAEALKIAEQVWLMDKNMEVNNQVYAWCLYYLHVKAFPVREEGKFIRAVKAITQLCQQADTYGPFTLAVFAFLKYLKGKNNFPAEEILVWTEKLDPNQLDDEPFVFEDETGKQRAMASKKEQYYMYRSKALLKLEKYQACLQLLQEGQKALPKLHHDNHIWFEHKKAKCRLGMKEYPTAIAMLEKLLQKKQEWFLRFTLAEAYLADGRAADALAQATAATMLFGPPKLKLKLYQWLGEQFHALGKEAEGRKHLTLVVAIRQEEGWPVDEKLLAAAKCNAAKIPAAKHLLAELQPLWLQLTPEALKPKPKQKGKKHLLKK